MPVPSQITTIVADGLALLTDQFRNQPNNRAILQAFLEEIQTLENATFGVIFARLLANAVGVQLDGLGALVGEPRNGRNDVFYKNAIIIRMRVNRSQGRAEDLIQIAALFNPTIGRYHDGSPSHWELTATSIPSPATLARLLSQAKAVGTAGVLVYTEWADTKNFKYASAYGTADYPQSKLASVYSSTIPQYVYAAAFVIPTTVAI